jgi:putative sterol carrier protein
MTDLTNLPFDITPEHFFDEVLPDVLGEVEYPDGLGQERMQFNIVGDEGIERHIGFANEIDEDGDEVECLTIEDGQAAAPPIAITASVDDFRAIVAGDLRDRIKDEVGEVPLGPRQLRHAFMPDAKVQQVKNLSGDLQVQIVDDDAGATYTVTQTIGGGKPNTETPSCKVILDVPTLLEIASGRQQAQQLFMMGKVRIEGDMSLVLQLMTIMTAK